MLLTNIYKNIVQATLFCLSKHVSLESAKPIMCYHNHLKTRNLGAIPLSNFIQYKSYSDDSLDHWHLPPITTEPPPVLWPTFFKTIGNFIQCNLVIRPFLDRDFDMSNFIEGTKQATVVVSNALATEDYESIYDLVAPKTLEIVKKKINTLSPVQKQLIAVNKDDIYLSFPYNIKRIYNFDTANETLIEITVVHHSLRGMNRLNRENKEPPLIMRMSPEYQKLLFACNYRFVRKYVKEGEDSPWTINMINHFMLQSLTAA